ncbi:hypothetical protein WJX72_003982 [[Myrmecia] bisecta]|uniref:Trafficking protein particle complex subunit 8 n=1 Tax=[Myrmecia] bisecta TaxID=41462 RepID=A0AAW1QQ94_9CHLO
MDFRNYITQEFTPVVMVVSSPQAEAACQQHNGLTVVDLLRPYGFFHHLSVPVRTVGDTAYRIKEFRLRFFASADMFQPSQEAADEYLKGVVSASATEHKAHEAQDVLQALKKDEVADSTPWFNGYRKEFVRTLAFGEHETFDHPIACLLVLHAQAEDPVADFGDLFKSAPLPPLMKAGLMEHKILKHYLLLHDDSLKLDGSYLKAEEKLRSVRASLGASSCHLARINSGSGDPACTLGYEGLWKAHIRGSIPGGGAGEPAERPPVPAAGLGARLTSADVDSISKFLEDFTVRALLPHLEGRVRGLNHQVTATRRGLRNQIKTLLWRKSSADSPAAPDYHTALSTLRLLSSDYKIDKAWRNYAGVQEMLGLTLFMTGGSMSEAEYSRQHGQFGEANYALMKAHFQEENLRAALLLEQAALYLLHISPPGIRKFAFHMVLAGLRFNACDQKQLGLSAYRQVLGVYAGRQWSFIEEHLHDVLGKQSREAGDLEAAVQHFMAMLPCAHSPEHWQAHYLRQFLEAVQQAQAAKGELAALELPLPSLNLDRMTIFFDDQVVHANAEALKYPEEHWRKLEAPFLPGSDASLSSWLDGASRNNLAALQCNTAVAGETLGVDLELANPLAVELQLAHLRLVYEHESGASGGSNAYVQVLEEALSLKAGARARVRLKLRPLRPGLLTLKGVEWLLNGHALGRRMFTVRKRTHRRSNSRLPKQRAANHILTFSVLPAMPRLDVALDDLPSRLLEGEMHRAPLLLRNTGAMPLQSIRMLISHPDVHCNPDNSDLGADAMACLAGERSRPASSSASESLEEPGLILKAGQQLYAWSPGMVLAPGQQLSWPLWLHPRTPGSLTFHCTWYYEPSGVVEGMKHRLLRLTQTIDVQAALRVTPSISICQDDLHRCLLRLDVENGQATSPIALRQLSCSGSWRVSSLSMEGPHGSADARQEDEAGGGTSLDPQVVVAPLTRLSLFFHLHPPSSATGDISAGASWIPLANQVVQYFKTQGRLTRQGVLMTRRSTGDLLASPPPAPLGWGADLMLAWELREQQAGAAARPARLGINHLYNCKMQEAVPVRMMVHGESVVRHGFANDGMCLVRLVLCLRNCLDQPASVCVEAGAGPGSSTLDSTGSWCAAPGSSALPAHASLPAIPLGTPGVPAGMLATLGSTGQPDSGAGPLALPATPDYVWCGRTRANIPQLEAGQTSQVELQVAVFGAGTYELTGVGVSWTYPDLDNLHATKLGPPFLVTVEEAA